MKIVLIGAGNVANHLGPLLKKAGHKIIQVYSPTKKNSVKLARLLKCKAVSSISSLDTEAEVYILAVKDSAIEKVISKLPFQPALILHTSGSIGIDVFPKRIHNSGVLYPLQTFSKKNRSAPKIIPFCVEGNNKSSLKIITKLATSLSPMVYDIKSDKRRIIHLSAVFANNFTNYLFTLSSRILEKYKINFDILKPLIQETVNNISKDKPYDVQSGPARRSDKAVIKKHLQMLAKDPEMKRIYEIFSTSISRDYNPGKQKKS